MPAAIALPITVVASSPSNISGNSVTSSNVIRAGAASDVVVIVIPPHDHFTSGRVDVQHELRDQRDEALAAVRSVDGGDVVGPVPERAAHDAERPAVLALHGAA